MFISRLERTSRQGEGGGTACATFTNWSSLQIRLLQYFSFRHFAKNVSCLNLPPPPH